MSFTRRLKDNPFKREKKQPDPLASTRKQMSQLNQELLRRPEAERQQIESYQKAFFDKLRRAIDEATTETLEKTKSDLAQRFGGSLNTTFGSDLLAKIEKNRLSALEDAQIDAELMGQQLLQDADQSRMRKLQALQGQFSLASSYLRNSQLMGEAVNRQQNQKRSGLLGTLGRIALGIF